MKTYDKLNLGAQEKALEEIENLAFILNMYVNTSKKRSRS